MNIALLLHSHYSKRRILLQDNFNSTDPMKLPTIEECPLLKADCKHRWLLLRVGDDFSTLKEFEKNMMFSRLDILEAMELAQNTGKTCKYPYAQKVSNEIPYGVYATPNNNMKEVFLGPYKEHEMVNIKAVPSDKPSTKQTTGVWTKLSTSPNAIIYPRNKRKGRRKQKENKVIIIGERYATVVCDFPIPEFGSHELQSK